MISFVDNNNEKLLQEVSLVEGKTIQCLAQYITNLAPCLSLHFFLLSLMLKFHLLYYLINPFLALHIMTHGNGYYKE